MNKLLILVILFTFTFSTLSFSQDLDCKMQNKTFSAGEKFSYVISYNWFVVFSEVGLVDLSIYEVEKNGIETYHFKANGRTFKWWDSFYKVRDTYETWVRKDNLRPIGFERNTKEGDYSQHEIYKYLGDSMVIRKSHTYDNPYSYDTIPATSCSFDVMSAILFTRNFDYSNFKAGDETPLTIVLDEKSYQVYFKYLGTEDKKVKNIGTFECLKFTLTLVEGTVFRDGEDMLLWVTNDKNHIPVYVESPIIIGSVKARITNIKGNRYPLTSKK